MLFNLIIAIWATLNGYSANCALVAKRVEIVIYRREHRLGRNLPKFKEHLFGSEVIRRVVYYFKYKFSVTRHILLSSVSIPAI